MFARYFGDLPGLIRKEDYLSDAPVHIDRTIYDCKTQSCDGLSVLHEHPFIEISYVESGSGSHTVWNEAYPISAGDLFVLNSSVPHSLYSSYETEPLVVRSLFFDPVDLFDGDIVDIGNNQFLYGLFNNNNFVISLSLKAKSLHLISQKLDEISLEIDEKKPDWKPVVSFHVALLLLQIKRLAVNSVPQYNTKENTVLISEVLQLIKIHYADPLFSMKSISGMLHISISSLSRNFYEVTGKYFSDYLCLYRIRQVISMLVESEMSIEEIAVFCGYNNMHSFYRQFKQVMGTTPRELQKQNLDHPELMYQINKELNHILFTEIIEKLQQGKSKEVTTLVLQALDEGFSPDEILHDGLIQGMTLLGKRFQTNEVYVGDVLGAAYAMNRCLDVLMPHLAVPQKNRKNCAVICSVKRDLHSIGKNLVKLMMEMEGIHCIDLGENISPQEVVDAVRMHSPKLVCLSATLTTTMMAQKDTIDALVTANLRKRVKIMIGGTSVTQEFADRIGADAYTPDAVTAAQTAKRLLTEIENQ